MPALYRWLLRSYPASLRAAHGAELAATVEQAWRQARQAGRASRVRLAARLAADVVRSWRAERRRTHDHAGDRRRDMAVTTLWTEARGAWRMLWRHRWSTTATLLTLALSVGAAAAVFGVVRAVVFKPLPFAAPDELVIIKEHHIPRDRLQSVVAAANFLEWRDRARSFETMVGLSLPGSVTLTGDGPPVRVPAFSASWNLLQALGVDPLHGRAFAEADGLPTAGRVAVVSHALWQSRYRGDPALIGRSLTLNGLPVEVVGILPPGFELLDARPDVVHALRFSAADREPRGRAMMAIARLRDEATLAEADAEMRTIAAALEAQWPDFDAGWRTSVVSLSEELSGAAREPLLLLLASVLLLLLVGCANSANLLLARAAARRREMAVRVALGASRRRLLRQLLVEGALLAVLGAAAGLLVAQLSLAGVRAAAASGALDLPRLDQATLDPAVMAFAVALTALSALVFSLVPAVEISGRRLTGATRAVPERATGSRSDRAWRRSLVVAQVAIAVVLVVGAGLAARTLANLTAVPTGFDPDGALTMTVSLPSSTYGEPGDDTRFFARALEALAALPGVERAGGIAWLPFTGLGGATSFTVRGQPEPDAANRPVADIRPVAGDYFGAMGIPLVAGRAFTEAEVTEGASVAVINQSLADRHFPGENPIGRQLDVNWASGPDVIVGVVGDVRHGSLRDPVRPMVYYPYERAAVGFMTFVLRAEAGTDMNLLRSPAVDAVQRMDADLPVTDLQTMRARVDSATTSSGAAASLVSLFAGVALVLAVVGIGGLLAAGVAQREAEFGIRLALGSAPGGLRRLVLREALVLTSAGLLLGLGMAAFATQLAGNLLFDVAPTDPWVYSGTAATILLLALLASDVPARRAARVDPVRSLRA